MITGRMTAFCNVSTSWSGKRDMTIRKRALSEETEQMDSQSTSG